MPLITWPPLIHSHSWRYLWIFFGSLLNIDWLWLLDFMNLSFHVRHTKTDQNHSQHLKTINVQSKSRIPLTKIFSFNLSLIVSAPVVKDLVLMTRIFLQRKTPKKLKIENVRSSPRGRALTTGAVKSLGVRPRRSFSFHSLRCCADLPSHSQCIDTRQR